MGIYAERSAHPFFFLSHSSTAFGTGLSLVIHLRIVQMSRMRMWDSFDCQPGPKRDSQREVNSVGVIIQETCSSSISSFVLIGVAVFAFTVF